MVKKPKKTFFGTEMGFKQAFRYVLDLLCYAYYVKGNNLVSDICFDELEKLWMKIFKEETAPMRAMEREGAYSNGIKVVYHWIFKEKK